MTESSSRAQRFDALTDRLPGLGSDPQSVRRRVEAMEHLLEGLFTIPGTTRRVGLDVVLDLVPVVGDAIGAALGVWMIWEARNLGLSKWQVTRMLGNVGFDFVLGAIPWIGAIPDYFFRSNSRNLKIIRQHLDRHHPATVLIEAEPNAIATR
jgi:hypothetical protein